MNFNSKNQVSSVSTVNGSRNFGYDSRGNVTSNGIYTFSYDLANQPTTTGTTTHIYDGNFKRVKKATNGQTTYFVYTQGAGLVSQYNKTESIHTDHIRIGRQLIARVESSGSIADNNSNAFNSEINSQASGGLTGRDYYLPFGQSISNENTSDSAIGYTGHVKDLSGLTYMEARYYDPVIGRFYSNDPLSFIILVRFEA